MSEAIDRLHAWGTDEPGLRAVLTDDAVWHVPGAVYRGREQVMGYFAQRRDRFAGTFRMAPLETLVGDEHAAVITVATVTKDGLEYSWRALEFYLLREGRIASCWMLPFDQAAFDAIWS